MDFNFAACYVKQKPKTKLINILIPAAVIGSLGGLVVYIATDVYELTLLKNSLEDMQNAMAAPSFQEQYTKANEISGQVNFIQNGVQSLRVMDHIFTEKKLQSPTFWETLVNGMPEGSSFSNVTIMQDGVVTLTGISASVDDIALMEESLRSNPHITHILVQSYNEQEDKVSFSAVFNYTALTEEERTAAKEALMN